MPDALIFASRDAFGAWLAENGQSGEGVWPLFGKVGGPQSAAFLMKRAAS